MSEKGWKEIPIGGMVLEAGNSEYYETGGWRSERPILHKEKCIDCMTCWVYCPDLAIMVEDGRMLGHDLKHCKGCGICSRECPTNAITMITEAEAKEEEAAKAREEKVA